MNSISFKLVSFLLGMTALTVVSSTGSVRAQTPNTDLSLERSAPTDAPMQVDAPAVTPMATVNPLMANSTPPVEPAAPAYAPMQTVEPAETSATTTDPLATNPTSEGIPEQTVGIPGQTVVEPNRPQVNVSNSDSDLADAQRLQAAAIDDDPQTAPETTVEVSESDLTPGTVSTSATHLTAQPETAPQSEVAPEQADVTVAQDLENVEPGRATRGGRSYVGIGGNLGLSGGTGIGQGGFLINSKIGLTRAISFRPSVIIGESTDFLLPVTYDFFLQSTDPFEPIPFAPFVGGGIAFSTSDDNTVGFLLTGGADVPLSRQFVANATVNAGFFGDTTSIGIAIGVGYQFSGF